ncbi:MAG: DUF4254 domain-containing protein [Gammaproteobacteria bacterium]|jgi:hypothetical protein|nr:DUF4254 domain-containing protein [Gammaproteobacteria bacterium]
MAPIFSGLVHVRFASRPSVAGRRSRQTERDACLCCVQTSLASSLGTMSSIDQLNAADVTGFHGALLEHLKRGAVPPLVPSATLWKAIEDNHHCNIALWDEEDQARRRDVPDSAIANSKRLIDGYNQRRNDAIERIDELVLIALPSLPDTAQLHSETIGALIDRLSILSLKLFHMDWQTRRGDVDADHRGISSTRLARLREQHADLAWCLDELVRGCLAGALRFKVYRQFKMYNDPKFNPWLTG